MVGEEMRTHIVAKAKQGRPAPEVPVAGLPAIAADLRTVTGGKARGVSYKKDGKVFNYPGESKAPQGIPDNVNALLQQRSLALRPNFKEAIMKVLGGVRSEAAIKNLKEDHGLSWDEFDALSDIAKL